MGDFQPAAFQPSAGFGIQMPTIGFQPMFQPESQPYSGTAPEYQAEQGDATTFQIGIPGGFQFVPEPGTGPGTPVGYESSFTYGVSQSPFAKKTRDAPLAGKKTQTGLCAAICKCFGS